MALLDSCLCCSLMVASFVIGVYALVAYVIAFAVELWWIVESEGSLPAPAHLLCAGYFVNLVLCAVLLHGLTVRRGLCLVVWLVGVAALALPEAGMVLYMALQYWRLQNLYGLTEITCWACRLFINAAGVVSVQSLYSSWKEEVEVMRRLRDLNMSSTMSNGRRGSVASSNGVGMMGLAYQNEGFVGSMSQLNGKPAGGTYAVPVHGSTKLKRSASSASRRSASSAMSMPAAIPMSPLGLVNDAASLYGHQMVGHHPLGHHPMAHLPLGLGQPGPLHRTDSASEFNAAAFDGMLASSMRAGAPGAADAVDGPVGVGGSASTTSAARFTRISKAQSLVDLSRVGGGSASRLGDYWRVETAPSRPVSVAYMMPPRSATQSLDRRLQRPRRAVSLADLGGAPAGMAAYFAAPLQPMYYRDAYGRDFVYPPPPFMYPAMPAMPGMLYRGATSKTSLGAASDDFRKYRDVAL